jgi:hypothetical protein
MSERVAGPAQPAAEIARAALEREPGVRSESGTVTLQCRHGPPFRSRLLGPRAGLIGNVGAIRLIVGHIVAPTPTHARARVLLCAMRPTSSMPIWYSTRNCPSRPQAWSER